MKRRLNFTWVKHLYLDLQLMKPPIQGTKKQKEWIGNEYKNNITICILFYTETINLDNTTKKKANHSVSKNEKGLRNTIVILQRKFNNHILYETRKTLYDQTMKHWYLPQQKNRNQKTFPIIHPFMNYFQRHDVIFIQHTIAGVIRP